MPTDQGWCDIAWLHPDGRPMDQSDWARGSGRFLWFISCHEEQHECSPVTHAIAILYNASAEEDGIHPAWWISIGLGPSVLQQRRPTGRTRAGAMGIGRPVPGVGNMGLEDRPLGGKMLLESCPMR